MRYLLASLPALIVLAFGILWWMPGTRLWAWEVSDENHPVELLTFATLLVGGLLGLHFARQLMKARTGWWIWLFYAVFSLGLLLIAMEEISWGQWFFKFDTPEAIAWRNKQRELNLHNIGSVYGKSEVLAILFGVGGLIGFALRRTRLLRRLDPPLAILPWVTVIAVVGGIEYLVSDLDVEVSPDLRTLIVHAMPEVTEMLTGIAAFLYVWINRRRYSPSAEGGETISA